MDKNKVSVDSVTFKFLYGKYKDFRIPFIVIVACTVLLVGFLLPQFKNLLDLSIKSKESEKNLKVLKNNFNFLSSLNEDALDSQLKIVTRALPADKDFIGIINAINYASSVSGAGVGDFQVSVGELSKDQASGSDSSPTSVSLTIDGDIEAVNRFIGTLGTTLPISEVTTVDTGDFSSTVTVSFYHKPFPSTKSQGISSIVSMGSDDVALINKLANFNYVTSQELDFIFEVGTPSSRLHPEGELR
jgi:Tfp pilus assembly protein PilO